VAVAVEIGPPVVGVRVRVRVRVRVS